VTFPAERVRSLDSLDRTVSRCRLCPRLVEYREEVARTKVKRFRGDEYWGRPVPGFGDPEARLLIVGLAPAAHGGNRTGRIFTGDRSGDWLFASLHRTGFANQPTSVARGDGLRLRGARITAVVHCAPPANKPATDERDRCLAYLVREIELLPELRVFVTLGSFAWDGLLRALREHGDAPATRARFGHAVRVDLPSGRVILGCYHPSQQNTFTGKLTEPMIDAVFAEARRLTTAGPPA
jgi:uracil-DNA glycosylase family 4